MNTIITGILLSLHAICLHADHHQPMLIWTSHFLADWSKIDYLKKIGLRPWYM